MYNFHWNDVGNLFPALDALSNVFLGINLAISSYCTIVVISSYPLNSFVKATNILLVFFVVYGLISWLFGDDIPGLSKGSYLIAALRTFLPIYTCYLFTKLGYVTERIIRSWFWIFLAETIIIYLSFRVVLEVGGFDELRTNNRGYLFVALLPFIYFYRQKSWVQYLILATLVVFSVLSVKRGAILVISLGAIYFFWNKFTHVSTYRKILVFAVLALFVRLGTYFVGYLYRGSDFFQRRVEATLQGNTSRRDEIVGGLMDKYINGDVINMLLGYGADGTARTGVFAHNDWVEMLFNQGPLGFLLFFYFWLVWFRIWRKQAVKNTEISFLIGLLFICNFPKTFFSMWYSATNIFVTLPIGYFLAVIYPGKKKTINSKTC